MGKLDVVILTEAEIPEPDATGTGMGAELQSLDTNVDKLVRAWPELMDRLRRVVDEDTNLSTGKGFMVDSIEFSIGIEAGFNFGLAATANASATITFKRG